MIEKCPNCGTKINYNLSEIQLIPDTNPQEAGIQSMCSHCNTEIYIKFRQYEEEITEFDENFNETRHLRFKIL